MPVYLPGYKPCPSFSLRHPSIAQRTNNRAAAAGLGAAHSICTRVTWRGGECMGDLLTSPLRTELYSARPPIRVSETLASPCSVQGAKRTAALTALDSHVAA